MNSNEFVHWLKGFIDGCESQLNETQLSKIKDKLDDVYDVNCHQQIQPVTPSRKTLIYKAKKKAPAIANKCFSCSPTWT